MKTNVYVTVMLSVESEKPLTEEQKDQLVNDVDYDFDYNEKGIKIVKTEITDSIII